MPWKRLLCLVVFLISALASAETVPDVGLVTVTGDGVSARFAEKVRERSQENLRRVGKVLGHLPGQPVSIILTGTESEFDTLTGGGLPEWSIAVAIGDNRIVVKPVRGWTGELDQVIIHEMTHIVVESAAGGRFVPRWFHEGCAQHLAGEWGVRDRVVLVWRVISGDVMTFREIEDVLADERVDAGMAYDESMLAIRRLMSVSGNGILADVIGHLTAGEDFPQAFLDATGLWPSEFESRFTMYMRDVYGWGSLYVLVPGIWSLIVMLAVVVWIIKRRQTRALLRRWEVIEAAENIINFPGPDTEHDEPNSDDM
jgi:hypothetical protein